MENDKESRMKLLNERILGLEYRINGSHLDILAIKEQLSELTRIVSEIVGEMANSGQ